MPSGSVASSGASVRKFWADQCRCNRRHAADPGGSRASQAAAAEGAEAEGEHAQAADQHGDRPAGMAEVGAEGANVLEVAHERISPSLTLNEVEVRIQLETRGEAHAEHLKSRLRERGYRLAD